MIKNRIINYGSKPADQFAINPDNFRIHPESQQKVVSELLTNIGWVGVVIESAGSGYLIDGHERVWEALKDNSMVPYLLVDLTEEEEKIMLGSYDATGHMADIDRVKLAAVMGDIRSFAMKWADDVALAVEDEYGTPKASDYAPRATDDEAPAAHEITCPHCGAKFYE